MLIPGFPGFLNLERIWRNTEEAKNIKWIKGSEFRCWSWKLLYILYMYSRKNKRLMLPYEAVDQRLSLMFRGMLIALLWKTVTSMNCQATVNHPGIRMASRDIPNTYCASHYDMEMWVGLDITHITMRMCPVPGITWASLSGKEPGACLWNVLPITGHVNIVSRTFSSH